MRQTILTIFLAVMLSPILKADDHNIKTNAEIIMSHMDHLDDKITVVGYVPDHHSEYVIPTVGYDPILQYVQDHPKEFKLDHSTFILKMFHKSVLVSYRQTAHPSIHFTKQKDNDVWEIDIDKWRGSPAVPISLFKHAVFEVFPHAIFHTVTSQNRIFKLIDKRYHYQPNESTLLSRYDERLQETQ